MILKLFVCWLILSVCFVGGLSAQECTVLRVSGGQEWRPIAYIDQNTQKPAGIGYDFARFIGKQLKIPVTIDVSLPWKRVQYYCETGQIDLIASIYWTKERSTRFLYTDPYFVNEARLFVVKGKEFKFDTFEDLIGRAGGMPQGGSWGEEFDAFAKANGLKLEGVPSIQQRIKKIMAGRNDYFIQDYIDAKIYLHDARLQDEIVALPKPLVTNNVFFAISPKTPCAELVDEMNAIIATAKEDGTLQAIIDRYLQ